MNHVTTVEGCIGEGQDRAEVIARPSGPVIALADGAGGCPGGAEAADLVVDGVWDCASQLVSPQSCLGLLRALDRRIFAAGNAGLSTGVVVAIAGTRLVGASVGDSQAWLVGQGDPLELTRSQQRKPLLGSGRAQPVAFASDFTDATLIVASDGLWDFCQTRAVFQGLRAQALVRAARRLGELPRLSSGARPDDFALVLVRHGNAELARDHR